MTAIVIGVFVLFGVFADVKNNEKETKMTPVVSASFDKELNDYWADGQKKLDDKKPVK